MPDILTAHTATQAAGGILSQQLEAMQAKNLHFSN